MSKKRNADSLSEEKLVYALNDGVMPANFAPKSISLDTIQSVSVLKSERARTNRERME